jgi:hypothetical protein
VLCGAPAAVAVPRSCGRPPSARRSTTSRRGSQAPRRRARRPGDGAARQMSVRHFARVFRAESTSPRRLRRAGPRQTARRR